MTIFRDAAETLAETIGEVFAEPGGVTYQERAADWTPIGDPVSILDAVVTDRGNEGAYDDDARFYQRAIELSVRVEVLESVADVSSFTINASGEAWRTISRNTVEGMHHIVAVRAERTDLQGSQPRHVRSRPSQVAG